MKKYCLGFVFSEDKEYVLLIEKKHPEWQNGKLNGVGGKVEEFDGSVTDAMQREMKEETGLDIPHDEWNYFALMRGSSDFDPTDWIVHCFSAIYKGNIFADYKALTDETPYPVKVSNIRSRVLEGNCIDNLDILVYQALKNNNSFLDLKYYNIKGPDAPNVIKKRKVGKYK